MLFRKTSLSKLLNDLRRDLFAASIKLEAGARIVLDRSNYLRIYRNVTIPSALMGLPITPSTLSGMYLSDALRDLRKVYHILSRIESRLREEYPEIYALLASSIDDARHELEESLSHVKRAESLEDAIKRLRLCIERVNTLASELKNALALHLDQDLQ